MFTNCGGILGLHPDCVGISDCTRIANSAFSIVSSAQM